MKTILFSFTMLIATLAFSTQSAMAMTNPINKQDTLQNNSQDLPKSKSRFKTHNSVSLDLGMNNYLENGSFPDNDNALYAVKPFGSWYVAINSVNTTPLSNHFHLQWGAGVSWYNFKFENERTQISEGPSSVIFTSATESFNFKKSKLTTSFVNASLVPVISFGKNETNENSCHYWKGKGLRMGLGGYAGYRLGSHTKVVYEEDGDKERDKDHDNFFLNNWRYGVRLQIGYKDIDFFANYDLNSLFAENKGPELNAFSFGVTLF